MQQESERLHELLLTNGQYSTRIKFAKEYRKKPLRVKVFEVLIQGGPFTMMENYHIVNDKHIELLEKHKILFERI